MPLDESKEEGPSEVLTFLGTEIDTAKMEVRLPQEKLAEMFLTPIYKNFPVAFPMMIATPDLAL